MKKLDLSKVPKLKKNPIFLRFPMKLKDPESFQKVEDELAEIIKSDHTHKSVKDFVACEGCNEKLKKRQEKLKELGFKSYTQYLEWKKIMTIIKEQKSFKLR